MTMKAGVLGVHLMGAQGKHVRVGTLSRDATGSTAFVVDETYLRAPPRMRPILSLTWFNPADDADTQIRLGIRGDKIALHGFVPPWFSNLLPEGALRSMVEAEMGQGDHDQFDVLSRLGADLPGAVLIVPDTGIGLERDVQWGNLHGFKVPVTEGIVRFSLAGVQLKFTAEVHGERLSAPARSGTGRYILKVPSERHRQLPEAEYTAMALCGAVGIDTARCYLKPTSHIDGVPPEFLRHGQYALVVERFDRASDGGRIHMEDMAQVLGASEIQKYSRGNGETILACIARFSAEWRTDILEGMRRIVVDVLIGNGDNHLKNWSFFFPNGLDARLSPAYDIVPTWLYDRDDTLAMKFVGVRSAPNVSFAKFRRAATYLNLDPDAMERELRQFTESCLDMWPALIRDLPLDKRHADHLMDRMNATRLAQEVR
jgi:serine/threonine-protein kinase HipA